MRSTNCVVCQEEKAIVGFERDDPVLECGHTLTIEAQLSRDALDELEKFCKRRILATMDELGVDFDTADRIVSASLFGY